MKRGSSLDYHGSERLLEAIAGFEGLPRLRSTHVGGFVLSSDSLGDWLPIEQTTMGRTIVQFDKDDLDSIGVPKFDFLGLGALSMLRRSFDVIEERTGERPQMYKLPNDDPKVYELISKGDTVGTFQIESRAQISSIVHTKPERIYDIVVQVALIRPGPIQAKFVHPYTRRRRGLRNREYLHAISSRSSSAPRASRSSRNRRWRSPWHSADIDGSQADELRRTMGNIRKQANLNDALERLRTRMKEKGIAADIADTICTDLMSFANYGFPESHAWSFALIAYATAYLKVHYPAEFYLGYLNSWPMGFYSPATLIHDAKRHDVDVRPPCLKNGDWECTTEPTVDPTRPALRIGWKFVRGVGSKSLEKLRAAHDERTFTSIADVVERAKLTRADVTSLALADAFASWEPNRHRAAWEGLRASGDKLPLAPADHGVHDPAPLNKHELIALDYHTTGTSLYGHPMLELRDQMRVQGVKDSQELEKMAGRRKVVVSGLVVVRQRPGTANGTIFLLLEDEHGFINVIVPNALVESNEEVVKYAQFILVRGRTEREGPAINVVGEEFEELHARELAHASRDFH